jgi:hypothetical protein
VTIGSVSEVVIASLVVVGGGWAAVAAWRGNSDETMSHKITFWSKLNPMIPFCLGVLIGHWFW